MNVVVAPGRLAGRVTAPPSKSDAHRLLICAALADGPTRIRLDSTNRDIEATADCLRALGAKIERDGENLVVTPVERRPETAALDCGESGSTLRFLLPVAAALGVKTRFTGHGRLPERPNRVLTDALRAHGAAIDSDLLPMAVQGPISSGCWELPGNVSSQYITGLLLALPLLDGDNEIVLTTRLESAPYVTMTLRALARFGIRIEPTETGWRVFGGQVFHSPETAVVEGDWSSAAFWLAANALGGDIKIDGLSEDSPQGDRAALSLLGQAEIDASGVPDLVPALAVAAANLPQATVITGAARLRIKESDRLQTVADALTALGHGVEITPDGLVIRGGKPAPCEAEVRVIDGANDHRIVMAAAVAAAFADRPVRILGAEAADKSYPGFFRDFEALGGKINVEPAWQ